MTKNTELAGSEAEKRLGDAPMAAAAETQPPLPSIPSTACRPASASDRAGTVVFGIAIAFSRLPALGRGLPRHPEPGRALDACRLRAAARLHADRQPDRRRLVKKRSCGRMGIVGFGIGVYYWVFYNDLILREGGFLLTQDLVVGGSLIVLVFEATRRLMGPALPIIAGIFLLYGLFGEYCPGRPRASRLWLRSGHRPARLRHRRHLRHAGLRVVELHLPVHPVRLLSGTCRHDQALHRRLARHGRPYQGRPGQGRGRLVRLHGHDLRLRRRQCRHHRPVHHPADEALRLQARLCRRRRGSVLDGRADHAAGHGRGRLHHGRDAEHPLFAGRHRGDHPGAASISSPPSGWCIWKPASAACSACARTRPRAPSARCRAGWYLLIPLGVLVYLLFTGFTPLFAGTMGLALTAVLILGGAIARGLPNQTIRYLYWVLLGLVCASFFQYGVNVIIWTIAALILVNLLRQGRARDACRLRATLWPTAPRTRCPSPSPAPWSASSSASSA